MDAQCILMKTDKGREEVATRCHHLGPRERSLLILVDGRLPAGLLVDKLKYLANAEAMLDQLQQDGFVAPVADPTAAGTAAPMAPGVPPGPPPVNVINFARRFVLDTLGPAGDGLAEQLEHCRSQQELLAALERTREALQLGASRRKAEEFWTGVNRATRDPI